MEGELVQMKQRLARAERQIRLLIALALVSVVGNLATAAKPVPSGIDANTIKAPFKVVDTKGRLLLQVDEGEPGRRALLNLETTGPRLRLFDPGGRPLVILTASKNGGQIAAESRRRSGFALVRADDYGGNLHLTDKRGTPFTVIECGTDTRGLVIFGPPENSRNEMATIWLTAGKAYGSVRVVSPGKSSGSPKQPFTAEMGVNTQGGKLSLSDQMGEHTYPALSK